MFNNSNTKLTWKEFGKMMITIAFPIALQNLLTTTASMVDTIMIGSIGELAVAAVGICSQIGSLLFNLYWGFVGGSILFLSQYWGGRDHKRLNKTFGLTIIFSGIIGIVYGALNAFAPSLLLNVYTDKEDIIALAIPYLKIVGFAYPLQVFAAIIGCLLKSTERVKTPLACSIVSLLVNFFVNLILIYGLWGFPSLGIKGAAIGTLLSAIVNVLLLGIFVLRDRVRIKLNIIEIFSFDREFFKLYISKLFPIVCNEILYGFGQMIINVVMGHQNEQAIAAMAAFRVCEGFVYAFFGGLANAASVSVGNEIGAGKLHKGYHFARKAAFVCPIITFVIVLILFIFHNQLFALFGLGVIATQYGKTMLMIYLFFGSVRTCCYIINECYRAGGEALFGTIIEVCGLYLLTVPAIWIAGMILKLPFIFVFMLVYTDELFRFFILVPYLIKGKWIKPMTNQGKAALEDFRASMNKKRAMN